MARLLPVLEQPEAVLMRVMAAGEAGLRAAARLQATCDSPPVLEPVLGGAFFYSAAVAAGLAVDGANSLCWGSTVHTLSPAAADHLAATAAGLAATCAKWFLLQQLREDGRPGTWAATAAAAAHTARQAERVTPPPGQDQAGNRVGLLACAQLLLAKRAVQLLLHSLLLLQRLVEQATGDQLTCRRCAQAGAQHATGSSTIFVPLWHLPSQMPGHS